MAETHCRRSFVAELLTMVAGGLAALASLAGLSSLSSGCGGDDSGRPDQRVVPKYGINDYRISDVPTVKYGPVFPDALAPKYGVRCDAGEGMAVKYGIRVDK